MLDALIPAQEAFSEAANSGADSALSKQSVNIKPLWQFSVAPQSKSYVMYHVICGYSGRNHYYIGATHTKCGSFSS